MLTAPRIYFDNSEDRTAGDGITEQDEEDDEPGVLIKDMASTNGTWVCIIPRGQAFSTVRRFQVEEQPN